MTRGRKAGCSCWHFDTEANECERQAQPCDKIWLDPNSGRHDSSCLLGSQHRAFSARVRNGSFLTGQKPAASRSADRCLQRSRGSYCRRGLRDFLRYRDSTIGSSLRIGGTHVPYRGFRVEDRLKNYGGLSEAERIGGACEANIARQRQDLQNRGLLRLPGPWAGFSGAGQRYAACVVKEPDSRIGCGNCFHRRNRSGMDSG